MNLHLGWGDEVVAAWLPISQANPLCLHLYMSSCRFCKPHCHIWNDAMLLFQYCAYAPAYITSGDVHPSINIHDATLIYSYLFPLVFII